MAKVRKVTVELPEDLLEKAQLASGTGITQTIRTGLQLVAASQTYARVRQLRGKVRFSLTLDELKDERGSRQIRALGSHTSKEKLAKTFNCSTEPSRIIRP